MNRVRKGLGRREKSFEGGVREADAGCQQGSYKGIHLQMMIYERAPDEPPSTPESVLAVGEIPYTDLCDPI